MEWISYSLDLRRRVVEFVQAGGSKADASRLFSVSLWCVNEWCKRDSLKPISPPGRPRNTLDWDALKKDIQAHPDRLLREHAKKYGVRINSIWHACKKMGLTHKKTTKYSERCHLKRINYLQTLRKLVIKGGKDKIVYVDESGFELNTYRPYAWSMRGRKAYGDKAG